ncbi:MAG: ABC transporter permease [Bulleidia sp.]
MYIFRNAFRCIRRALPRNILIGIIVLVIAAASCIGLSIRQAAETARTQAMESMHITASITFDRTAMMSSISENQQDSQMQGKGFDKGSFSGMMSGISDLSIEEYQQYAQASSVSDFHYTLTSYINGNENLEPVVVEEDESTESMPDMKGMDSRGGMVMGSSSDFTLIGYSSESAMTSFMDGSASVTEGTVFDVNSDDLTCMISQELALYNGISVNDVITVMNPNDETDKFDLKVCGIYTDTSANQMTFSKMGSSSTDPANRILVSAGTLQAMETQSSGSVQPLTSSISSTYVFDSIEDYERFETEVHELGLSDSYTVTSQDVSAFNQALAPLETLSTIAGYFLVVILVIGALILIVMNIFSIRDRKYEIGVLTAIGMSKGKAALQFLMESLIVTCIAVFIGAGIGAVSSVPVTNTLLENQITSASESAAQVENNFGRGGMMDDRGGMNQMGQTAYISEVSEAMNVEVAVQMGAIALGLSVISSAVSVLFILRYQPLKILSERD